VLMFDVFGAVIAIITLALVTIPNPQKNNTSQTPNMFREMKEGLREIYSNRGLLMMFVFMIVMMFFLMPIAALFPLMTLNHFSGNTYMMSIVEVGWGLGMLLGGLIMGMPKFKVNKIVLINTMYIVIGITFLFSGVLPSTVFWIFVALTFIAGISGAMHHGSFTVVLQTTIDPAALGRVFSIFGSVTMLPSMIGLLQTGLIADKIGITNAFVIAGAVIALLGMISFYVPSIRVLGIKMDISVT